MISMKIISQLSSTNFLRSKQTLLLFVVLLVGFFLRFTKLGEIPIALNRDEASLGYTAWSIWQRGTDEHGVRLPLNIQSFGDWKLPLYVYTLVPVVATFGLNAWSVRLPSTVAGVVSIGLVYILARLLFEPELKSGKLPLLQWLPLLLSAVWAVSPWSVHLSRIAYEANLTLSIFLLGMIFWFMGVQRELSVSKTFAQFLVVAFPLSALCFGLTLFGYHSFQVFTPLMGIGLLIGFREKVFELARTKLPWFALTFVITLVFVASVLLSQRTRANQTKFSGISVLGEERYAGQLFAHRQLVAELPGPLDKVYVNTPRLQFAAFWQNLVKAVSPEFLFITGGTHGSHNFFGMGNLYAYALVTIPLGMWWLLHRKIQHRWVIWYWLMAAFIAPILTIVSAHSVRLFPLSVMAELLSVLGMISIFQKVENQGVWKKVTVGGMALVGAYSIFYLIVTYFFVFPILGAKAWPWQMQPMVEYLQQEGVGKNIFIEGESYSPYIWFLFMQPARYALNELQYYPATGEGFVHVKQLKNVYFGHTYREQFKPEDLIVLSTLQLEDKEFADDLKLERWLSHPHVEETYGVYRYEEE